jgi:hypothetical protein
VLELFRRRPASSDTAPSPESRYRHAAGVTSTREGDRTVLLDHHAGAYFGLDEVGTRVWELLGTGASLGAVVDALAEEYDAPRDVLERDTAQIVLRLRSNKLLTTP